MHAGSKYANMQPEKRHFGIAGPWAWTLDPEMLDSGPIFRPKNTQNLVHYISSVLGKTYQTQRVGTIQSFSSLTLYDFSSVCLLWGK